MEQFLRVTTALLALLALLSIPVLILWLVSLIGPIAATVSAEFNKGDARAWAVGGGVLAGYMIILLAEFAALKFGVLERLGIRTAMEGFANLAQWIKVG